MGIVAMSLSSFLCIPDARKELSIELSDLWPEAEKMLRRLSAGKKTGDGGVSFLP